MTSSDAMTKYDLIYQQPMCPQVNNKNAIQETSAMRLEKNFNSTMLWQWLKYGKIMSKPDWLVVEPTHLKNMLVKLEIFSN